MANINKNIIMQAGAAVANATNRAAGLSASTPEPGSIISVIQLVNGGRTIGPVSLAHFTESVRNKLLSLLVNIELIQSGSGTPSPDNVRPISGRTGLSVYDDPKYGGTVAWNQLLKEINSTNWIIDNATGSFADGVCSFTGNASSARCGIDTKLLQNHIYIYSCDVKGSNGAPLRLRLNGGNQSREFTATGSWQTVCGIKQKGNTTVTSNWSVWDTRNSDWDEIQFKNYMVIDLTAMFGSTIADYIYGLEQNTAGAGVAWFRNLFPKDYYPYDNSYTETCVSAVNGDPYWKKDIDWTTPAGTVYGGTLDVVTGLLTVDRANIASYNGEAINEPWLSSMDAYTPGATPTTGAQVVYELATPLTYQLTAQDIITLVGDNYIWSDSGDVTITE